MKLMNLFKSRKNAEQPVGASTQATVEEAASDQITVCLNCGATLVGKYCHQCGQKASTKETDYKFRKFLVSYISRIYLWHPKIPRTLYALLTKPGYVINEYIAGKHMTYTDPLVINRFFLLVITTIIGLFPVLENSDTSLEKLLKDDRIVTSTVLTTLEEDHEYLKLMDSSPRDTIQLNTSLQIIKLYPTFLTPVSVLVDTEGQGCDTLIASVPSIFLRDSILMGNDETGYQFSMASTRINKELTTDVIIDIWRKMVDLIRRNIGLIILLITPILAFIIRLMHLKTMREHMHYFIFSMYYSCIIEIVILLAFLLTQLIESSKEIWEWVIMFFLWGYLTLALKKTFAQNSWTSAIIKALFINLTYLLVILLALIIMLSIAIIWIAYEQTM